MEDFDKLIRDQKEYKHQREEKYRHDSKYRLGKILKKKVETTMIGALSSIEEHFSFLWTSSKNMKTYVKKLEKYIKLEAKSCPSGTKINFFMKK